MIVKVLVVHNEGTEQLRILRKLARGPVTMLGANHCLPLMDEFILDHVVFGIFPKAGGTMLEAYDSWSQNSVGDIMNMLSQALEGLVFIHGLHIAHRVCISTQETSCFLLIVSLRMHFTITGFYNGTQSRCVTTRSQCRGHAYISSTLRLQ